MKSFMTEERISETINLWIHVYMGRSLGRGYRGCGGGQSMEQCAYPFATRRHCIKGIHCHRITFTNVFVFKVIQLTFLL